MMNGTKSIIQDRLSFNPEYKPLWWKPDRASEVEKDLLASN